MRHPDVQALVYSSFGGLRHCRYLLLRIDDAATAPAAARQWLRQPAVMDLVRGGGALRRDGEQEEMLAVAFTHAGLLRIGLVEDPNFPFPSSFSGGMNQPDLALALGDDNVDQWDWGDVGGAMRQPVHLLLAHYRRAAFDDPPGALSIPALSAAGMSVVSMINTCPAYLDTTGGTPTLYEPFGFRDGLSQPVLRGMADSKLQQERRALVGNELCEDSVVADGEFILGLRNEYGDPAHAPDAKGWPEGGAADAPKRFATHGSYLAVRQIRQHVAAFETFAAAHPAPDAATPSLVETMLGRRVDGTPLVACPQAPKDPDAFRYRMNDAEGFGCPLGSHIRRGNPRDMQGWDVESGVTASKLHRLIRRARVYSTGCTQADEHGCGHPNGRRRCGRGLFFIAVNADLERQFEFVQQRWIVNPNFAGLAGENDPILGGSGRRAFTVQGPAAGLSVANIPRFTELIGGGYFFLPGLAALRFLSRADGIDAVKDTR